MDSRATFPISSSFSNSSEMILLSNSEIRKKKDRKILHFLLPLFLFLLLIGLLSFNAMFLSSEFNFSSSIGPPIKKNTSLHFTTEKEYNLILLNTSYNSEAVCLDGSPGAFYFKNGKDSGKDNWILNFEGGEWCFDVIECSMRRHSQGGSSNSYPNQIPEPKFGILGNDPDTNPRFYNWNKVEFKNCDYSSLLSYRKNPLIVNGAQIYFRGSKIFEESIQYLIQNGDLENAKQVILTGWSSGGISVLSFCDTLKSLLPKTTRYSCLVDSSLVMDIMNVDGKYAFRERVKFMFPMQNLKAGCIKKCINDRPKRFQYQCFFPQYSLPYIQSPLFFLNSLYDTWAINNILCDSSSYNDYSKEKYLERLSSSILNTVTLYEDDANIGYFLTTCSHHVLMHEPWNLIKIEYKVASDAFFEFHQGQGKSKVKLIGSSCQWNNVTA